MGLIVTYNGITDKSIGCHASTRPSIPAPVRRVRSTVIAGRDGAYIDTDGEIEDIAIEINFSFTDHNPDNWGTTYRRIKAWLLSGDNGNLSFSDDSGVYYRVKNVSISSTERTSRKIGRVTAVFVCDGYTYLVTGDTQINLASTIRNQYSLCKPTYTITGNGTCVLTVNGKAFTVTVGQQATIDSDRMLTFRQDSTWANTTVTGDYQDLWLKPGQNSLSATSGFTCKLTPYWRCL